LGEEISNIAQGEQLTAERYLAAVPQLFPAIFYFANPFKMWADLRQFKNTFNSGVLLTDLSFWNEATYASLRHYLDVDAASDYRLYNLGDETVFNLMFKRTYIPLEKCWNCWGYGQINIIGRWLKLTRARSAVNIIHWSGGHQKPWDNDNVIYSELWRSFIPTMRSQRPTMMANELSKTAAR
ncbi:MAG: glycosyltransferase, partial [Cyanobacteria bacterium J06598_3]